MIVSKSEEMSIRDIKILSVVEGRHYEYFVTIGTYGAPENNIRVPSAFQPQYW